MATMRDRRRQFLENNGFLPYEARELSRTSRDGLRAPYWTFWIRSRRRLLDNARRYNWTEKQYRDYIRKQYTDRDYVKRDKLGRYRPDVWAMLRDFEERSRRRGEEYESPWRKRTKRKTAKKQEYKRTTRREALMSWIDQLDKRIERTTSEERKKQLLQQRANLQRQLDRAS